MEWEFYRRTESFVAGRQSFAISATTIGRKIKTGAILPRDMRRFLKAPENSAEIILWQVPSGSAHWALTFAAASDMVVYGPMAAGLGSAQLPSCAIPVMGSTEKHLCDVVKVDNRGKGMAELSNCGSAELKTRNHQPRN